MIETDICKMYNHNNSNVWPSMPAVVPSMAYSYGNQGLNQMAMSGNVVPQNVNYLSSYYNQNQTYGQHYAQDYNYYPNVSPYGQIPVSPAIASNYLPNQSVASNSSVRPHLVQTNHQTISATNKPMTKTNNDEKWLELLNPTQRQVLDQLNKEQEAFEKQFMNWESDFENWKVTNQCHPNITAYNEYVAQWQQWRQKLIERQQLMKDLRTRTLEQLHSQVRPLIAPINVAKPPPPPSTAPKPPPPPPPPKQTPPPPPPPPKEDYFPQSRTSSFLGPQKILEIKEHLGTNDQNFRVNFNNSGDMNVRAESNNSIQEETSTDKQTANNANKKDIEVIEIDCEGSDTQSKSIPNPDQNAISKVAEDLLFIQKQQELLKSLENLKNVKQVNTESKNKNSEEVEVLEQGGFNVNDIVSKMKAIKPPENPNEANKILSELPALQGIIFKPNPQIPEKRFASDSNPSFNDFNDRPLNNNNANISLSEQRMQPTRHRFPLHSQQMPPHFQTSPYGSSMNNRAPFPRHQTPIENRWPGPRSSSQQLPPVRKYSAQTIDYSHGRNTKSNVEPMPMPMPSPETPRNPTYQQKPFSDRFSYDNNTHYDNYNRLHSGINDGFDDTRKSAVSVTKAAPDLPSIEETYDYRDIRYFTRPKSRIVLIDDLLKPPTRDFRPQNIVIILRGLPGSGKTYFAKLIKEKEIEFGGNTPRILSIDDYFMAEIEREVKAPETGKLVKTKEYVYEYEKDMESCYRASLLKTYKKTVDDRLFSFIIIDAINELIADIEDFYSYAIKNDFVVYVIEMITNEPLVCHKNNTHNRTFEDIKQIHNKWQSLPDFMLRLDIRSLLQKASIKEVEMTIEEQETDSNMKRKLPLEELSPNKHTKSDLSDSQDQSFNDETPLSRWERMEASESKLDKLDSFKMKSKPTIEEYLQVTDDYDLRNRDKQKRVRWADIEEEKKHDRVRQRGFEVGLNWHQYMDPQHPSRVLAETKYF